MWLFCVCVRVRVCCCVTCESRIANERTINKNGCSSQRERVSKRSLIWCSYTHSVTERIRNVFTENMFYQQQELCGVSLILFVPATFFYDMKLKDWICVIVCHLSLRRNLWPIFLYVSTFIALLVNVGVATERTPVGHFQTLPTFFWPLSDPAAFSQINIVPRTDWCPHPVLCLDKWTLKSNYINTFHSVTGGVSSLPLHYIYVIT